MTKIAIKSASISKPDLFVKALIILPEAAVIAFRADQGILYITDDYADAALSHLKRAHIAAEIVARENA